MECESSWKTFVFSFGVKANRSHKLETHGKIWPFNNTDNRWLHNNLFYDDHSKQEQKNLFFLQNNAQQQCCWYSNPRVSVIWRCKYLATVCICTPGCSEPLWMLVCVKAPLETEACASYHSLLSRAEGGRGRRCGVLKKVIEYVWEGKQNEKHLKAVIDSIGRYSDSALAGNKREN